MWKESELKDRLMRIANLVRDVNFFPAKNLMILATVILSAGTLLGSRMASKIQR